MPRSIPQRRSGHAEIVPPLSKRLRITDLLKLQVQTFPQKELSPEEIELWIADLDRFPIAAIEFAFDNWRRNGRFFPVYANILDLCIVWEPPDTGYQQRIPKQQYQQGYGETDMQYLYKRYVATRQAVGDRALTDGEIEMLMQDLDKKRGHAPTWRRAA